LLRAVLDHWLLLGIGAAILLVLARVLLVRTTDARFGVRRTGGRGGTIFVSFPAYVARAEFEIGGSVDLIIYAESFRDTQGRQLAEQQRSEAISRLWSWSRARGLTLDIPGFVPPHAPAV